MSNHSSWQIWIDTGGTFTDCLALDPSGDLHRAKVLSSSALRGTFVKQIDRKRARIREKWSAPPNLIKGYAFRMLDLAHSQIVVEEYDPQESLITLSDILPSGTAANSAFEVISAEEAPILAARLVTQTPAGAALPAMQMRLATTRGTNALLERRGAAVALFITRGFGDLLLIGNQQRPDIFALEIRKPQPLYQQVVEVDERLAADGSILQPLRPENLEDTVARLLNSDIRVAAVALMHSYRNPAHERKLTEFLLAKGFEHVSRSSELAPFIKLVPRAQTTVLDAYLSPVIANYLDRVKAEIPDGRLHVMTSAGGLISADEFWAKDSLLSGPAGGVVGAAMAGRRSGFEKIIAFDMGGTSTDVARYDGDFEYVFEHQVGEAHLVAPALAIESVAAGGGSICSFDGYRLQVGPESAGAEPGPACYGAGGPLTLTDVNLLLGRLDAGSFEIPITLNQAQSRLDALCETVRQQSAQNVDAPALLEGFLDIANERMADAIRKISLRQGYDPADYVLVAFGGAGAQHACAIAQKLGVRTILIPQDASLLSALGIGHALIERFAEQQILEELGTSESKISGIIKKLSRAAVQSVHAEGIAENDIEIRRRIVNLRFVGQDSVLSLEYSQGKELKHLFEQKYQETFGHRPEGRALELESIRVVASSRAGIMATRQATPRSFEVEPGSTVKCRFGGQWQDVGAYDRAQLQPGARLQGPALIFERHSATVVEPGWQAQVDQASAIVLRLVKRQKDDGQAERQGQKNI